MELRGVSLGQIMSFRDSLSVTSAALDIRVSHMPFEMQASVFMLQGTITVASVKYEPLDILAARL